MQTNRRRFLQVGALAVAAPAVVPAPAITREHAPRFRFKTSLAAYSLRQLLDLKNPKMTLLEFIDKCDEWGCDGVELTEYYFPKPITPEYISKVKHRVAKLGLVVTGTPVGNEFTHPPGEARDKQIAHVKNWIDISADLGSPAIRIFAGSVKKGSNEEEARKNAIESINIVLEHAAKRGVFLALENHGGIVATAEGMLAIIKEIKHDWFGVNLDTGNFHTPDPYGDLEKIAAYSVTCQVKAEVNPLGGKRQETDYKRIVDILSKAKYRGYLTLEYESAEDPMTGCPKHLEAIRKAIG
jgi:sugar phosphate isomerase/epimerase